MKDASPLLPLGALLDTAAALSVLSGIAYVIGYGYYNAYCDAVGLHALSIVLPAATYVRQAIVPLALLGTLFWIAVRRVPRNNHAAQLAANAAFIAIPILALCVIEPWSSLWFAVAIGVVLLIALAIVDFRDRGPLAPRPRARPRRRLQHDRGLLRRCRRVPEEEGTAPGPAP